MIVYAIWIAGLVLELAILLRALATRMYVHFPVFYSYIFCVFASSASLWPVYARSHELYHRLFWYGEFITLIMGYGVVLEITHHAFKDYPGADRVARYAGIGAFAAIFGWFGVSAALHKIPMEITALGRRIDGFDRDLRIVQATFLGIVAVLAVHYGIELSKNVRGLALGMGLFVAVSLVGMALTVAYGKSYEPPILGKLQRATYALSLGFWLVGLWSYAEVKNPPPSSGNKSDYRNIVERTREKLRNLRAHFPPAVDS
jgi:hypothetical protein